MGYRAEAYAGEPGLDVVQRQHRTLNYTPAKPNELHLQVWSAARRRWETWDLASETGEYLAPDQHGRWTWWSVSTHGRRMPAANEAEAVAAALAACTA